MGCDCDKPGVFKKKLPSGFPPLVCLVKYILGWNYGETDGED